MEFIVETNHRPSALKRRAVLSLSLLLTGVPAMAQPAAYPTKPITLIVGFPPGGSGDFVGRELAQRLGEALGQTVVVENRGGANGLLAANAVAAAPADGYTLFLSSMGLTTNPHLYSKNRLDPVKDFTPISLLVMVPNILVVNPALPANNLDGLIRLAKSQSVPLTSATTGKAAPGHLASELLQRAAGIKLEFVTYKGSGPALNDVIAGHVNMSMPTLVAALPHIKSGRLRAIAVTGAQRSGLLPDVPTLAEGGLKELETGSGWYGLFGPARLPKQVIERLDTEVAGVMRRADIRERFVANGADPIALDSAHTAAFVAEDYKYWGELVKAANIKGED
jgi:tripartite-type tricarboxylate transporter receptor subunit TctC